ncbi:hypothetical protein N7493_001151 [Penicillium malachiteum]|uniref:Uncharacterized protein n=1 Tax=Penicillium malachiteum TaxID=1324776 RepID=A0AAD6HTZ3_9EURO|nr:hypothetical protein N7493_001151 [Penicillium malachiteum]
MPYIARGNELPEIALRGGLVDPRADHQHSFNKRISCQDVTDFISNTAEALPWSCETRKPPRDIPSLKEPISDLLPGLVVSGGDRTGDFSAEDPAATVRLTSTWNTVHVRGEGAVQESPHGAPCWALKSHGIGPVEPGQSKFYQLYDSETDTLTATVNLARRADTPQTSGMRNARVADAVDYAVGLLADAAILLEARDKVILNKRDVLLDFAEVREVVPPTWPKARKPLAPKLSGVADSPDKATDDLFSASVLNYSIGTDTSAMADRLSFAFAEVTAAAEASASPGPHIDDIRIVKGCNYGCLRQKTIIEDNDPVESSPCMVVWNNLDRLARYKLADAVFCHVYYDSGGGEQMAAIAGLGCVAHDWIDLGPDIMCGEVSNIIPSLTRGSLQEDALAEFYARLIATKVLPETQAVIDHLVSPVIAYVKGADTLPTESEFVGTVLAAELAYPQGQNILELWDLAIVMCQCGAMWAAGVAGLCYTHTGKANCDRARHDLADHTWN